ncbi:unnamed protein product [Heligmosomoides polygyrus]|uniref:Uncharacterized protein n=1 Tax=Heligmosomoides polygyrus TaxID=6339 RepID=A0A3P8B612_HELPZ|nr:unnamed protein product [Heligmosomoides polygyrus]
MRVSCLVDQDCPVGTVCSGDRCMKKNFSESSQCSNNFDCRWFPGHCLKPTGLSCQSNQDCAQGVICVNNRCYETPPSANQRCTSNSDCSQYPGTLCANNKCQKWNCPPLTTCQASNRQCSSDLDCAQYPGTYYDISCQSDSDCPSGTQCTNNKCASPGQTCFTDNQCPFYPHFACIRSTCVKVHQNCTVDEDCPNRPSQPVFSHFVKKFVIPAHKTTTAASTQACFVSTDFAQNPEEAARETGTAPTFPLRAVFNRSVCEWEILAPEMKTARLFPTWNARILAVKRRRRAVLTATALYIPLMNASSPYALNAEIAQRLRNALSSRTINAWDRNASILRDNARRTRTANPTASVSTQIVSEWIFRAATMKAAHTIPARDA